MENFFHETSASFNDQLTACERTHAYCQQLRVNLEVQRGAIQEQRYRMQEHKRYREEKQLVFEQIRWSLDFAKQERKALRWQR